MARPKAQVTAEAARLAFERAADVLGLQDRDRGAILGGSEAELNRMGQFLAIYELSGNLLGESGKWLKSANSGTPFEGKEPLSFILEDPGKNLPSTLRYLRGASGGWA